MNLRYVGPGSWWSTDIPKGMVLAINCMRVDFKACNGGILAVPFGEGD